MDFLKRWDSIVPFQQRGGIADQLEGMGVHLPYRVEHRMIVRVEKVLFELGRDGLPPVRLSLSGADRHKLLGKHGSRPSLTESP
jgi:hypothetical protein